MKLLSRSIRKGIDRSAPKPFVVLLRAGGRVVLEVDLVERALDGAEELPQYLRGSERRLEQNVPQSSRTIRRVEENQMASKNSQI